MKCKYHPEVDSQQLCSACKNSLCDDCANRIRGKAYCRECLEQGAEWVTTAKDFHISADSPKRAACFAIIPGIGAVYNNEYLKAFTYFTVFAALIAVGGAFSGVFVLGAFVFLVFTMFDAYRSAERNARRLLQSNGTGEEVMHSEDNLTGWGIFLILAGILFILQNFISSIILGRMWPAVFIVIGIYLVYRSLRARKNGRSEVRSPESSTGLKKD